jgi:hypothetical protein
MSVQNHFVREWNPKFPWSLKRHHIWQHVLLGLRCAWLISIRSLCAPRRRTILKEFKVHLDNANQRNWQSQECLERIHTVWVVHPFSRLDQASLMHCPKHTLCGGYSWPFRKDLLTIVENLTSDRPYISRQFSIARFVNFRVSIETVTWILCRNQKFESWFRPSKFKSAIREETCNVRSVISPAIPTVISLPQHQPGFRKWPPSTMPTGQTSYFSRNA